MKENDHARRVGAAAILFALVLRLWSGGVPEILMPTKTEYEPTEKTGRTVRFSSSMQVFSPKFVETPPLSDPEPAQLLPPRFTDAERIELYYAAAVSPDIPALLEKKLEWQLYGEAPKVLILHTHGTESYTKQGESYTETSAWRTTDEDYNMLSIGSYVGALLEEAGIPTVQDRELHDYPSYNGSYVDARKSIRELLEAYPSIELILDLHRDASGGTGGQLRTQATVRGQLSAQLMVVVGTNQKHYEENLALGLKLHSQLEVQSPGIMRPLQLRNSRFNQDLCPGALIIEVGAAGNTHAEAITAAGELARAVIALAEGTR